MPNDPIRERLKDPLRIGYSDPNPSLIPCIPCSIQVYVIIETTLRRWRRS